jgi:hypothetical protein
VTVTPSARRPVTGERVILVAEVTPAPDGGTVRFAAGGSVIAGCGAVPVSTASGTATCHVRFVTVGPLVLEALYSGDVRFAPSLSSPVSEPVRSSVTIVGPLTARRGSVTSVLRCARLSGGCAVTVSIFLPSAATASAAHPRSAGPALASRALALRAGRSATVVVSLPPAAQARLASAHAAVVVEAVAVRVGRRRGTVATAKARLGP